MRLLLIRFFRLLILLSLSVLYALYGSFLSLPPALELLLFLFLIGYMFALSLVLIFSYPDDNDDSL